MPETDTFRLDLRHERSSPELLEAIAALATVPAWRLEAAAGGQMPARSLQGGGGRAVRLAKAIQAMPSAAASELVEVISEIAKPMSPRELEQTLRNTDLDYRQRRAVVAALKHLHIAMVIPK